MNTSRIVSLNLMVTLCALAILGCGQNGSPSGIDLLQPTSIKHGYGGKFGPSDIADTADAYNGDKVVGRARALALQDSPTGGPKTLNIQVTHYSVTGQPVYSGYVLIQAGFRGGTLISVEDISGTKKSTGLCEWQFGQ